MLFIPFAVGAIYSGLTWRHVPLFLAWLAGYFAFFAAGLWLRSGGKPRYWPPVRTHGLLAAALAVVVIVMAPDVLHWAVLFLPCSRSACGAPGGGWTVHCSTMA